MASIHIIGGKKLKGRVRLQAAKNAVLPIIAACILTKSTVVLKNCPPLLDILAMLEIIRSLGGRAEFDNIDNQIQLDCSSLALNKIDDNLTGLLRSSIFILGPLLSRFKAAKLSLPGGCKIGSRPIDIHLDGLKKLGVTFDDSDENLINCDGSKMKSGIINLKFPSVGATENLMMAAALLDGATVIHGAAKEPEVVDLANFISHLGAKIYGAGTDTIIIEGSANLLNTTQTIEYTPISDRIVAGTYLCGVAMTGGRIQIDNVNPLHIYPAIQVLKQTGVRFRFFKEDKKIPACVGNLVKKGIFNPIGTLIISASGRPKGCHHIETSPYPLFPTDLQAQFGALFSSTKNHIGVISENLFESRFGYIEGLKKMGAVVYTNANTAVFKGSRLVGASVRAEDLRGGAALCLAGLKAEGKTIVSDIFHIDRGYYKIEEDLKALGANIWREQ